MLVVNFETGMVVFAGLGAETQYWARRPYPREFPGKEPHRTYVVKHWTRGRCVIRDQYPFTHPVNNGVLGAVFRFIRDVTLDRQHHRLGLWYFGGLIGVEGPLTKLKPDDDKDQRQVWAPRRWRCWWINPPPRPFDATARGYVPQ